MIDKY